MSVRKLLAAAAVIALVTGCAGSAQKVTAGAAHSPVTGSAASALSSWKDFPAGSSPRPLVITGPTVDDPTTGFRDGDDKLAYLAGQFTVRTALPGRSATWKRQSLITAAQALTTLRGQPSPGVKTTARLVVTAIHPGIASFSTDRGQRRLAAWFFTFADVRDPAAVLAIGPKNRWPKATPTGDDNDDLSAEIPPTGHAVTIGFTGAAAGTGPCDAQYKADVAQSASAVLVTISQTTHTKGGDVVCDAVGYRRFVTLSLTPALGGRVLIDSDGAPLPAR